MESVARRGFEQIMNFHYYQGDWTKGKVLLDIIVADTIVIADKLFEDKHKINPVKGNITVTLEKLNDL